MLCQSLLFIKKEILAQVFCCEFNKILQISFFTEHRRTTAFCTIELHHLRSKSFDTIFSPKIDSFFTSQKMKKSLIKNFIFCEVCNFANFTTHQTKQCTMNNAFRDNSPSHKRLLTLSVLFKQSLQISNLICDYSKF